MCSELEVTKQRLEQLQQQTTQMMRDRSAVNTEINALRDELAAKDTALQVGLAVRFKAVRRLVTPLASLLMMPQAATAGQAEMMAKMQKEFSSLSTQAAGVLFRWGQRIQTHRMKGWGRPLLPRSCGSTFLHHSHWCFGCRCCPGVERSV